MTQCFEEVVLAQFWVAPLPFFAGIIHSLGSELSSLVGRLFLGSSFQQYRYVQERCR
jgi:hypothetical protein